MAMEQNAYEYLKIKRRFVLEIVGQPATFCGIGACDPYLKDHISALSPFRHSSGAFKWLNSRPANLKSDPTVAAASDVDGGNLVLAAGTEITIFQLGIDDAGTAAGLWWTLTTSDTDLTQGGDPVDLGFLFFVTGMVFDCMTPFQRGGTGADASDPKLYSAWLNKAKYQSLLQSAVITYTAIEISFGSSGQTFRLGVGELWPKWGGAAGCEVTRNGLTSAPGLYLPYVVGVCIASRDQLKKLSMKLRNGVATSIQSDEDAPTIAGSQDDTTGTINAADNGSVYTPVRVVLIGYIVCVPEAQLCGLPTLSPMDVETLTRLARQMQQAPQLAAAQGFGR